MDMLVQSALAAAKPRDREVFILHTMEGFSVAEIAAITDRRPESINASILAAREHLRRSPPIGSRFQTECFGARDRLILRRTFPWQSSVAPTSAQPGELNDYPRRYPGAGGVSGRRSGSRDQFLFSAAASQTTESHRDQAILVKDLVHQALREAEKTGGMEGPD